MKQNSIAYERTTREVPASSSAFRTEKGVAVLPTAGLISLSNIILGDPEITHLLEEEMRRVANIDLLRVSQVCVCWHQLIMGTPSLWSFIDLDLNVWAPATDARPPEICS